MDLVSIIIPTYNTLPQYLHDCLDSCLNQTYHNLEILIIDDNSDNQNTLDLLKQYEQQDARIKVIYQHENRGQSYNRNVGIDICHGKYFTLIDHDDMLLPEFIEKSIAALQQHDVDFSMAHLLTFNDDNRHLPLSEQIAQHKQVYDNKNIHDKWNLTGKAHSVINLSTMTEMGRLFYLPAAVYGKVFNTQRYLESGVCFDPSDEMRNVEDEDWLMKIALHMKNFVLLDFYGAMHRMSITAASSGTDRYYQQSLNAAVRRFDLLKDSGYISLYYTAILHHALNCVCNICQLSSTQEQRNTNWQQIKEKFKRLNYPLELRTGQYDYQYSFNLSKIYPYLYPNAPQTLFFSRNNLYDCNDNTGYRLLLEKWAYQGLSIKALYLTYAESAHICEKFNNILFSLLSKLSPNERIASLNQVLNTFPDNGVQHFVIKNADFLKEHTLNPNFDVNLELLIINILHKLYAQNHFKFILIPETDIWAQNLIKSAELSDVQILKISHDAKLQELLYNQPELLALLNFHA